MQVINIGEVAKFRLFDTENGVLLENPNRRVVRLEVNCEVATAFRVQLDRDTIRYLGHAEGHAEISFVADGPCSIWATPEVPEAEVWWWCSELESFAVEVPDAETFTTITERRARNPELEAIMHRMMSNVDRRFADLEYSLEQARQAEAEANAKAERLAAEVEKKNARKRTAKALPDAVDAGARQEGETDPAGAEGSDESGGANAGGNDD